ncbi:MAG TPA: 23S rRNA pseudouridine(1911/1915/1917) synthase RluD [Accumulibacter sp.]|nr:23S rRNA pseudouridine(1911/1915/1917) synthase RluD [Accumulibacter sp.]HQC79723.1 23S rRNA pseudouridine(1911/1915/1917) synthase RluD [Accumulibacter sp.]
MSTKDTEPGDYSANPKITLTVPTECSGLRLDQVLAQLLFEHSRSRLQNWVRAGRVAVGGNVVLEPRRKLWAGEGIELTAAPDERAESSTPENIPLQIVYEDAAVIVLDKPVGLVVHPGNGNWHGTLLNALLHHAPQLEKVPRAGIVHRLDKDTSGLIVVAKTLEAQTHLVRQLQARTVKRIYQALVRGIVDKAGIVDSPIGRHPTQRTRMAVVRTGKPARTRYRSLEHFQGCTLVECALETGRTHQIRVHMTSIGHPLVGDPVYGGVASRVPRGPLFAHQALHACRLALVHPLSGKAMSWRSGLPDDLAELIDTLRQEASAAHDDASGDDEWDDDDAGVEIFYVDDEPDNEEPDEQ